MAVGAGKFKLYSKIDPVLSAGDYRYVAEQQLSGTGGTSTSMPVDTHQSHVRVRAPRYQLPPDQVLSTFPPAGSEGSYGSRLPQVVIKRRTLPWERDLEGQPSATPWLALVVIAEGEGQLELNRPVADCVSAGVTLHGTQDVALGNCLAVRRSVVHSVFPTRLDVPLLAHAREVDINDTELMMGDDDGFLSVVIANRLPLPGVADDGTSQPVKYLACLVNLEGQFESLLPEAPARRVATAQPLVQYAAAMTTAEYDRRRMEADVSAVAAQLERTVVRSAGPAPRATDQLLGQVARQAVATTGAPPFSGTSTWTLDEAEASAVSVYAEMAADFSAVTHLQPVVFDPVLRFPVLLHWSFTSYGATTFRSLMEGLDSGLIGTVPEDRVAPDGREPLEVVETGHVGLVHRTRHGDRVRSWYRGPLVPHPPDGDADRLPLAHVADQLRTVIPDGREDLSLASAFEIGRLLALSHPSMIAAMLQWRRANYHVERRRTVWGAHRGFLDGVLGDHELDFGLARLGVELGRGLVRQLTTQPDEVIGSPRPLIDPGRPLEFDRTTTELVAAGFGLATDTFQGDPTDVLGKLKQLDRLPGELVTADLPTVELRDQLHRVVDRRLVDLVSNTLDLQIGLEGVDRVIVGPTVPGTTIPVGGIRPFEERFAAFRRTDEEEDTP